MYANEMDLWIAETRMEETNTLARAQLRLHGDFSDDTVEIIDDEDSDEQQAISRTIISDQHNVIFLI